MPDSPSLYKGLGLSLRIMKKIQHDAEQFAQLYSYEPFPSLDPLHQGSVYKVAAAGEEEEELAIKCIDWHPNYDDSKVLASYERALALKHEQLMPYKAVYRFKHEQALAHRLIMPYIAGGALAGKQPDYMPMMQKHSIIKQGLELLDYMHQAFGPVLNIDAGHLFWREGKLLLSNYLGAGAWQLELVARYTCIAPEQFSPDYAPDLRSDLWAWAVLSYWLCTGYWPFGDSKALNNRQIKERILYAPLPERLADLPAAWQPFLRRCLEKDPDLRPQSAQAALALWPEHHEPEDGESEEEQEAIREIEAAEYKPSPIGWHWLLLIPLAALAGYLLQQALG